LRILDWLGTYLPWKLVETDFYEQYEFSLFDVDLPLDLSFLKETSFLNSLRSEIKGLFNASLGSRVDITAHKLIPGQRIRIHNDRKSTRLNSSHVAISYAVFCLKK